MAGHKACGGRGPSAPAGERSPPPVGMTTNEIVLKIARLKACFTQGETRTL